VEFLILGFNVFIDLKSYLIIEVTHINQTRSLKENMDGPLKKIGNELTLRNASLKINVGMN
jgi:hypothetical protein